MALFDFGFGSKKSDAEKQSTAKTTGKLKRDTTTKQRTTGSEATTARQETTERILAPEVEATLQNLLLAESGRAGVAADVFDPAARGRFAADLATRAQGADAANRASIQRIISASRARGEQQLRGATTRLAQASGSALSSNVVQLGQRERENLETQLGGLEGQLTFEGRNQATQELLAAFGAAGEAESNTAFGNVIGIADLLRGATRTTSGTQQQQVDISSLVKALEKVRAKETGKQQTRGDVKQTGSGFNIGFGL